MDYLSSFYPFCEEGRRCASVSCPSLRAISYLSVSYSFSARVRDYASYFYPSLLEAMDCSSAFYLSLVAEKHSVFFFYPFSVPERGSSSSFCPCPCRLQAVAATWCGLVTSYVPDRVAPVSSASGGVHHAATGSGSATSAAGRGGVEPDAARGCRSGRNCCWSWRRKTSGHHGPTTRGGHAHPSDPSAQIPPSEHRIEAGPASCRHELTCRLCSACRRRVYLSSLTRHAMTTAPFSHLCHFYYSFWYPRPCFHSWSPSLHSYGHHDRCHQNHSLRVWHALLSLSNHFPY